MDKRRVLVVGGKDYNVPTWARRAFVIDLIDADKRGDLAVDSPASADVIVVCVNYVSNSIAGQANAIGRKWKVPVFKARDGWASAVAQAARNKVDWFVDAVQLAGQNLEEEDPHQALEAATVVENAWKTSAISERKKTAEAARREADLKAKLKEVTTSYERVCSGAEQRVLAAIQKHRRQDADTEHWAQVEVGLMKEAVEALLLRMERLETHLRTGVSSPPNGGAGGVSESGGRR